MSDYLFPAKLNQRLLTPADQLLAVVKDKRAMDPAFVDEFPPFFWAAEISSNRLDSYYTRMGASTLTNFVNDAATGISFQDSHDTHKLGFGMSLTGRLEPIEEGLMRALAEFYTVPGVHFGGEHSYASTDSFILAVRSGLARDVSVGFYGGDHICDICGNSIWDYSNCPHIPGLEYPIGDRGEQTLLCTATIEDAHLSEVSAVYDGACPQAMILKMERSATDGLLSPKATQLLQVRYRLKLPEGRGSWSGADLKGRSTMEEQEVQEETPAVEETPVAETTPEATQESDVTTPNAPDTGNEEIARIRAVVTGIPELRSKSPVEAITWLVEENARLRPLADMGRTYRNDLIEEALSEGVRAMGNLFPLEQYRGMLSVANLDAIKAIRASFQEQAKLRFPGGAQINETKEKPVVPVVTEPVNAEAHRA